MKSTTPSTLNFGNFNLFRSFKSAAILGLLLSAVSGSSWAVEKLPTISAGPTENESNLHYWQPAIGKGLAQMMTTELSKMKDKFRVVESLNLEDLRNERRLGESGEVAANESVKKGQWQGADYIFIIKVTRFGNAQKQNRVNTGWLNSIPLPIPRPHLGPTDVQWEKSEYEVQLDWRITDAADRTVIESGQASGKQKDSKFNIHTWGRGGFGNNNSQMADSAIGKACMMAISNVVEQIKPLKIGPGARTKNNEDELANAVNTLKSVKGVVEDIRSGGKEVWVSLGSENGFKIGDKIKIYKPEERRNKKDKVMEPDYKEIGEITLEKVKKNSSMGRYVGSVTVEEDWVAVAATVNIDSL